MPKDFFTDEQVEIEIERLLNDDNVRLAKKEMRIRYKRRQYMYGLRNMEKRGKQLAAEGYTLNNIESRLFGDEMNEVE